MPRTASTSAEFPPPVLEAEQIRRNADDGNVLLDDVSFAVAAGETVAIVGPPGSGKTLLLRALALLDPLDGGIVRFHGAAVAADAVPAFRRSVVYVQQRAALVEGTVRDNLRLPYSFRSAGGEGFVPARAEQWLEAAGRGSRFLERTVADLSGGELQIIALVRALQLNPAVLLIDEPTSSLDDHTQAQIESILSEWLQDSLEQQSKARAMVIVTHDLPQAERMSHRWVILEKGRILNEGDGI